MPFQMKYKITPLYMPIKTKRRSGILMPKVGFQVAHDTGNPGSTARQNVKYFINSANEMSASTHIFVDDKEIIECIPALTGKPEKAWHVLYDKPLDNQLYGDDANDIAIGIEYCYGKNINADEAYKRYVWLLAYIAYKFNLNPANTVIGHFKLDPQRKTDPQSGLHASGRSYEQLLKDVVKEYNDCLKEEQVMPEEKKIPEWKTAPIDELAKDGLLSDPDYWKAKLDDAMPVWAVMAMINRIRKESSK